MTPKAVVNELERIIGLVGEPRQLRDAIELVLLASGKYSEAQAAEESDKLNLKVAREVRLRREASEKAGDLAVLHLRGTDIVHGSSFVLNDDKDSIKESKVRRTKSAELLGAIRKLTFNQFERFGSKVLGELGAKTTEYTKHAGDQGIDFYGEITVGTILSADPAILRLMHDTRVIVVGQAKHYPDRTIGPNLVRELVGALSLAKTATFSKDGLDLLDKVQLRPFSPLLAMLFTTGEISRGARNVAQKAGLIAFSGSQLAVFLADRGVGLDDNNQEFDSSKFLAWLSADN